eukprot:CAMPEP_0182533572 /NCGR_PEP_ID=MMETSP1323-20130603/13891_1 /TAXON_ID=236787 /ORGANISM="Florenciella parvula, Strain RCC1693" /LENGTH=30 /DNA_ID= /DNA_START= /DNA_END= /DNA_ORIENTATION=
MMVASPASMNSSLTLTLTLIRSRSTTAITA